MPSSRCSPATPTAAATAGRSSGPGPGSGRRPRGGYGGAARSRRGERAARRGNRDEGTDPGHRHRDRAAREGRAPLRGPRPLWPRPGRASAGKGRSARRSRTGRPGRARVGDGQRGRSSPACRWTGPRACGGRSNSRSPGHDVRDRAARSGLRRAATRCEMVSSSGPRACGVTPCGGRQSGGRHGGTPCAGKAGRAVSRGAARPGGAAARRVSSYDDLSGIRVIREKPRRSRFLPLPCRRYEGSSGVPDGARVVTA